MLDKLISTYVWSYRIFAVLILVLKLTGYTTLPWLWVLLLLCLELTNILLFIIFKAIEILTNIFMLVIRRFNYG